jgi:hypothetical protein
VLLFSVTGALQLFSLHEAHGAYQPPALVEKLGKLHKDQVFALKARRAGPKAATPKPHLDAQPQPEPAGPALSAMSLKWFFLFVACGLLASTLLGLWMALQQPSRRRMILGLLALGAAIPVLLLQL